MDEKKSELREQLLTNAKNTVKTDAKVIAAAQELCEDYKAYLDASKTEREAVDETVRRVQAAGFVPFERGKQYAAGDKVYYVNRGKAIILAVIGEKKADEGVLISAAHIDSPRLDLKPNPLYESDDMAFLKTHYYGGIKKYQWTVVPLSLHGVVCKKDGTKVEVCIGEDEGDPQFVITDLLIHLSAEQMQRKAAEVIKGEGLNVLIGSLPIPEEEGGDLVKLHVMKLLNEKYGIVEGDFVSAEIEAVPAYKARDIGLDRSLIGAYGHDDRVCAYPSVKALLDLEGAPQNTCIVCLADKEEIGSMGNTGLDSAFLANFVHDIAEMQGCNGRAALSASRCLSADVSAAYDPNYADVFERRNAAFINNGVSICKYTGSRGKSGSSDASAEFVGKIRTLFDKHDVLWQINELGRVDAGGGGTVALTVAAYDVDVLDIGVPVLSMHAPLEVVSKIDVYMTYAAIKAFFKEG